MKLNSKFIFQPFNNWLDGAKEDLLDIFIVHSVEEIQVMVFFLHSWHGKLYKWKNVYVKYFLTRFLRQNVLYFKGGGLCLFYLSLGPGF